MQQPGVTCIPVVFAGTNSMINLFADVLRNARRAYGQGMYDFRQPAQSDAALKEAISQLPRPQKPAMEKVAWDERDRLFAAQVRHHVALLYQSNFRTRISATLLARATGKQALIEKFSGRLPPTNQTIHALEEGVDTSQCRRVRRAVHESQARGEVLARWRILRIAGLAPPLAPAVEKKLATLLKAGV